MPGKLKRKARALLSRRAPYAQVPRGSRWSVLGPADHPQRTAGSAVPSPAARVVHDIGGVVISGVGTVLCPPAAHHAPHNQHLTVGEREGRGVPAGGGGEEEVEGWAGAYRGQSRAEREMCRRRAPALWPPARVAQQQQQPRQRQRQRQRQRRKQKQQQLHHHRHTTTATPPPPPPPLPPPPPSASAHQRREGMRWVRTAGRRPPLCEYSRNVPSARSNLCPPKMRSLSSAVATCAAGSRGVGVGGGGGG